MRNTDIILTAGHERIKFRGACFFYTQTKIKNTLSDVFLPIRCAIRKRLISTISSAPWSTAHFPPLVN